MIYSNDVIIMVVNAIAFKSNTMLIFTDATSVYTIAMKGRLFLWHFFCVWIYTSELVRSKSNLYEDKTHMPDLSF